jgi:peptidoglycan-associated lipoprotein
MHMNNYELKLGFLVASLLLATSACGVKYPDCETDKDCQREGKAQEFCVARKCQQCRDNSHCGEGRECTNGKCNAIPGYCRDSSQCPAGTDCIYNRCRPCQSDSECPAGTICEGGRCGRVQCTKDEDCPQDKDCQRGRCVGTQKLPPPEVGCRETVYFGFNLSSLTKDATSALSNFAACLKKTGRGVDLVGHADPRGTTEYNMALSDRRAQSVRDYLRQAGIESTRLKPVPRGNLDATGTDEASWARDRRVDCELK